jgi:hypothetical protein
MDDEHVPVAERNNVENVGELVFSPVDAGIFDERANRLRVRSGGAQ